MVCCRAAQFEEDSPTPPPGSSSGKSLQSAADLRAIAQAARKQLGGQHATDTGGPPQELADGGWQPGLGATVNVAVSRTPEVGLPDQAGACMQLGNDIRGPRACTAWQRSMCLTVACPLPFHASGRQMKPELA